MRDLTPSSSEEARNNLVERFAKQSSISVGYARKLLKENQWDEKAALLAYADSTHYEDDSTMLPSTSSSEKLNDIEFEGRRRRAGCSGKTFHTPAYAFILPNLDLYPEDFRRFLERDMIEMATLRRLENSGHLNWWCTNNSCQRLWPLSTTGDGNCLLHAASLGMWGVHDRQLMLRNALHDVLTRGSRRHAILRRWRWSESKTNLQSGLVLSEAEWLREWNTVVEIAAATPRTKTATSVASSEASKPTTNVVENSAEPSGAASETSSSGMPKNEAVTVEKAPSAESGTPSSNAPKLPPVNEQIYESLESIHVFVLAHILKRPIIVVADTVLRNANGEELSPIPFGGIYLPLEWPADKCHRSPLVLCYDSAHFSALVAMRHAPANALQAIPITDRNRNLLPLHFAVDPGPDFTWWNDEGDMKIAATFEAMQTDDWRIDLIGRYMDIVKMNLRRGSVKKTTTVANGNVPIPSKLLTLAAGSSSSSSCVNSKSPGIIRNTSTKSQSRIFGEVLQHFKRIGKFTRRKKNSRDVAITANELKQASCVVTVLLHNYTHQYMDHMVNTYIISAKERFENSKGTPSAPPPSKNRMSRSFSASSVMLTCINGDCEEAGYCSLKSA
ncbi:hypothetical protein QR680_009170 [Steinernema hermaphroditum]|uniref:ubiquitinyl hydrolase 1 n=1 Tax=Steinernema hermaphroditum TaxID=289476 RepID=A0AA39ILE1_9BILA|nr:hypothetical protein QR680_009170 [Steinernema hermaphroditum]